MANALTIVPDLEALKRLPIFDDREVSRTAIKMTNAASMGQSPRSRCLPNLSKLKSGKVSARSSLRPQKPLRSQPR